MIDYLYSRSTENKRSIWISMRKYQSARPNTLSARGSSTESTITLWDAKFTFGQRLAVRQWQESVMAAASRSLNKAHIDTGAIQSDTHCKSLLTVEGKETKDTLRSTGAIEADSEQVERMKERVCWLLNNSSMPLTSTVVSICTLQCHYTAHGPFGLLPIVV